MNKICATCWVHGMGNRDNGTPITISAENSTPTDFAGEYARRLYEMLGAGFGKSKTIKVGVEYDDGEQFLCLVKIDYTPRFVSQRLPLEPNL